MILMALDCEYEQPCGSLIQIGAAAYNVKSGEILGTIELDIKHYKPLSEFITKLTGITTEKNQMGMSVSEAYQALKLFHKVHNCFMNPVVWGTGVVNDSHEIYRQLKETTGWINVDEHFMGRRALDLKTLVQFRMINNGRMYSGGLHTTIKRYGLKWDDKCGKAHNATADALNTALLHIKINKEIK